MDGPGRKSIIEERALFMSRSLNRRQFVQQSSALIGAGLFAGFSPARAADGPNDKLNIAAVGVANKARHNLDELAGQNIVAFCDVDENFLKKASERWPEARTYRDYRKMLEAEANKCDAVVVSTADHTHAPAAAVAVSAVCMKPSLIWIRSSSRFTNTPRSIFLVCSTNMGMPWLFYCAELRKSHARPLYGVMPW